MTGMCRMLSLAALSLAAIALNGCDSEQADVPPEVSSRQIVTSDVPAVATPDGEQAVGTPMESRVAILGFLNKQNGKTRDLELKPGQSIRSGRAIVRLRACERTAPWETYPDAGAFVQLLVNERRAGEREDKWKRVFSGWLFRENPAANVVQHPVYDVWVKECRMRFPGEEEGDASPSTAASSRPADSNGSNAAQPPAEAAPAPAGDAAGADADSAEAETD